MRIKSLRLKNFKRFTDLTLQDIPENAGLVLLIGSNGSGKSSIFDAFEYFSNHNKKSWKDSGLDFRKTASANLTVQIETFEYGIEGLIANGWQISNKIESSSFYGRTSFRQVPRLLKRTLGTAFNITQDDDRAPSFIDRDIRFENDLEHIFGKLLKEFFRTNDDKSEIKEKIINPINDSLERIFGQENGTKLRLLEMIPPLEGRIAEINFIKGNSIFHYNYLSAGEKEVFNILINLVARVEYYQNTIFFFDEIDLHLNTKLQYAFIKEITENWLPDNCQLWTASHSLGFIDYANDTENAAIIDFDDLDFDNPQILKPKEKNNFEVFEIAVGKAFIDKVVQGRKIIFSENTDTFLYNNLNIDNVLFFVANDKTDVFHKAKNHFHFGIIDRDYLSDDEIQQIKISYPFLFILPYYSIENLLYHPDNLKEYYSLTNTAFSIKDYKRELTEIKNNEKDYLLIGILQARSGYPFFKENEKSKELKVFKENSRGVVDLLKSDDFETFYKVFPAKDNGTTLKERQNLSKVELAKTNWFKAQVEQLINNA
jgi:predicted ATP-binding protein involved in virulence